RGERKDHTLQPTALLHEAFARLQRLRGRELPAAALVRLYARAMRRVLVDHARRRRVRCAAEAAAAALAGSARDDALPEIDDALRELAARSPRLAHVVELRFFAGLGVPECARSLGVTERTVVRDWAAARELLRQRLEAARAG